MNYSIILYSGNQLELLHVVGCYTIIYSLVDWQNNVLEDLLHEGHSPDCRGRCEFHKGRLRRTHPAKQEEEQAVITERNHRLKYPENSLKNQGFIFISKKKIFGENCLENLLNI